MKLSLRIAPDNGAAVVLRRLGEQQGERFWKRALPRPEQFMHCAALKYAVRCEGIERVNARAKGSPMHW
jgi:hypothetical protein